MLRSDTFHKTRFNTRHEQQGHMWQKTHSHLLKVLSVFHMLQYCTKSTIIRTMKSGNKVTVRWSVGMPTFSSTVEAGGLVGNTQPTLRHKMPGINEIRNSLARVPALGLCKAGTSISQFPAFRRVHRIPPGRQPLLLEAAASDFWHRKVKVQFSIFFMTSPFFFSHKILLVQLGFFPPLPFVEGWFLELLVYYWSL